MKDKELQLENGNYTRIVNKILEELVKVPLLGAEMSICLFVIRKTWGFNKKTDKISITQFEKGVCRSRPTIVKALKNLKLFNILQLVKVGSHYNESSEWKFNKHYNSWVLIKVDNLVKTPLPVKIENLVKTPKLVKTPNLVKGRAKPSKENIKNLVKTPKHTKDNTKDNTKEREKVPKELLEGYQWNDLIDPFSKVNPMFAKFYSNKTQRVSLQEVVNVIGFVKTKWLVDNLKELTRDIFAPRITTPTQLSNKLGDLLDYWKKKKKGGESKYQPDKITITKQ